MSVPHAASAAEARLVTMANQIATFFASQPEAEAEAVAGIENHIRKFWDPRMRGKILGLRAAGGDGLHPLAREAIDRLTD
jgi:formate dehydrogenase subunit delta